MRRAAYILLFILLADLMQAQEFRATVEINTQKIQASDRRIYETLRTTIYEFVNNRVWTNYNFKAQERIECSILLTINERTTSEDFKGELTIALRRPVYNSTYTTVLFNFIDKNVEFSYIENQPVDFNENSFTNNLSSIVAYYVYLFLGLDFDTFVENGGDPFYQAAQNIVNLAQSQPYKGWKSFENQRNRYWILENLTNASYSPLRKFLYEYHMKGLDQMYDDPVKGRTNISNSLKYLQEVKKLRSNLIIMQIFADAKRDELVSIFSEGTSIEKSQAVNILKEIDPANSLTYQKILQP